LYMFIARESEDIDADWFNEFGESHFWRQYKYKNEENIEEEKYKINNFLDCFYKVLAAGNNKSINAETLACLKTLFRTSIITLAVPASSTKAEKQKLIDDYVEHIRKELQAGIHRLHKEQAATAWQFAEAKHKNGCLAWIKIQRDNADFSVCMELFGRYKSCGYGIFDEHYSRHKKVSEHRDALGATVKERMPDAAVPYNVWWPCRVNFPHQDWMSDDFILALHAFRAHGEASELHRDTEHMITTMLHLPAILEQFSKPPTS